MPEADEVASSGEKRVDVLLARDVGGDALYRDRTGG
jgi:hypothetical protein